MPCSVGYLLRRFGGSGLLVQVDAEVTEGQLYGEVGGDLRNQRRNRGAYLHSLVGGVSVGNQLQHCTVLEILLGFNCILINFYPEDGGTAFRRNVDAQPSDCQIVYAFHTVMQFTHVLPSATTNIISLSVHAECSGILTILRHLNVLL